MIIRKVLVHTVPHRLFKLIHVKGYIRKDVHMFFSYKIIIFIITSAAIFATDVIACYGQNVALGFRSTGALYPSVKVGNPSPSNIFGPADFTPIIGIYGLKYFKTGRAGIKASVERGGVPHNLGIDAPRNAFGTGAGGEAQINSIYSSNDITYNAFTVSATYKLPVKRRFLEFTVGPSVRHYGYDKGGYEGMIWAYNRSVPYDFEDPAAGPADLVTRIYGLDTYHLSFPISVDYVIRTTKRTQFKVGIMHNIAAPLSGELEVMMNGKIYEGTFKPRTGFWGLNLQYERLSKKSALSYTRRLTPASILDTYRKAIIIENYIRPGLFSVNYDMRLKKDVNSGFGVAAGVGFGNRYYAEITNDNKTSWKRLLALPFGLNYILGPKRHALELGVGITPQIPLEKVRDGMAEFSHFYIPARIGYRFQPLRDGLIARVAILPIAEKTPTTSFGFDKFNVGLSVGYSFK